MDDGTRSELATRYRTGRLTTADENHLFAWLEARRREDQWPATLERIFRALEHDPDLTEDHSWPEIEDMGRKLEAA